MSELPPYARFLGVRAEQAGDELLFVMPFGGRVTGRPGYLHGGAIAGLLEFAAYGSLRAALGEEEAQVKPINVSIQYLRGGIAHDTFAAARVTRLGKRVANVEAHAWQLDRDKPIAAAQLNILLRRA